VEAGREEVGYGGSGHVAAVRRVVAPPPQPSGRGHPPGQKLLEAAGSGADLGERLGKMPRARGDLPLVGPVAADVGLVEIAVTALNDFEQCPMMYRWRHELRVPTRGIGDAPRKDATAAEEARRVGSAGLGGGSEGASSVEAGVHSLDAATLGTLYHRCMELLDPGRPQRAAALVRQAAGEMELTESVDLTGVEAELAEMLARFEGHELFERLRAARQALRELDFMMRCGQAVLRGQIDLLLEEADGSWRVVDYKSDRVDEQTVGEHAAGYELQLLLYAAAAGRHVSERPAGATLYFLRPALTHEFSVAPEDLEAAQRRAAGLAGELITARRSGHFELRRTQTCRRCPYAPLCGSKDTGLLRRRAV